MTSPDGRFRFVPAPGWPVPPAETVIEAGWQPDPSWPAAPDGWVFWQPIAAEVAVTPTSAVAQVAQSAPVVKKPGFLEARKQHKAEAAEVKAKQQRLDAETAQRQQVLAERSRLQDAIEFIEGWPGTGPSVPVVLKKGEAAVGVLAAAGVVEVKRSQGHFVAGSSGVSVRVAKGVRVRAGAIRGHYVPGDEAETQIDTGSAVITSQRIVFTGSRQTREWKFDNLLGRQLVGNKQMSWIELPVSNRQKMSALSFPKSRADAVVSAVELALTFHAGEQADLLEDLREQLAALQ